MKHAIKCRREVVIEFGGNLRKTQKLQNTYWGLIFRRDLYR